MPIAVHCVCQKSLRVKDELAGRKIRCPACAAVIAVPAPEEEATAENEAMAIYLAQPATLPPPKPIATAEDTRIQSETSTAKVPRRPLALSPEAPPPLPKRPRRRERQPRQPERRQGPLFVVEPQIITGLLMMVGAVVWFAVGLWAGRIFFYPPIMFCLGIAAVIRGFTGSE